MMAMVVRGSVPTGDMTNQTGPTSTFDRSAEDEMSASILISLGSWEKQL